MDREGLHDGREDGLEPLESLDVRGANGFADMLERMSKTAFGGRALGEAYHVLRAMADDPDCTIVLTVSGAMTVAKMGLVICDMIESGLAHVVVCTGAVMAHGLSESIGNVHYKNNPAVTDKQLYEWGYNRVYDTLEMEANLCDTERVVSAVLDTLDWSRPTCSHEINRELGRHLFRHGQMPSILGCAYANDVPVFVPAFTDSELGLDVATYWLCQAQRDKGVNGLLGHVPPFNPFGDLHHYALQALSAKTLGIVTIGGGVPRNWAQQVGPFVEIMNMRVGTDCPVPRFQYGVRICPEPVHWGGLSGCTYSEGISWGKFIPPSEGGMWSEVYADATIALPLIVKAVLERL